ncbi:precorrin-6y C5,15-methyltransferase (decarboxylating) subunit CbiE [Clostridium sp. cel8]|jgi:cobalt-precorrin-7 (C5)-methyltransferase|uniref:precorrin-6y C5,15-methyltransferase (decarboxylating) subunit CbiE n=1 Tax=Clostridium sp. cel8 TaxID=2663123 RepID=UPI0015F4E710|nr:precorrin-6y C5,15-methyltransferase (decarboxylating) subunit CbiE [Clostridium sp. cel8]MBA5850978.1 precorrin-6y C5,15-methyltransferase (decarboxylating) subunit CbiE [Clostridium sp. cel8]
MCEVFVVGIGPGDRDYILPKAVKVMNRSDVVLGFKRALSSIDFIDVPKMEVNKLKEIISIINSKDYKVVSIVASGDPMFYGIAEYLGKNYSGNIEVVPGISSFQYMMSKIGKSWQNAYLGSLHGRDMNIIDTVKQNKISIWLTDDNNSPNRICSILFENKIESKVYIGENLSYENESITSGYPDRLKNLKFSGLSVVVIENLDIQ